MNLISTAHQITYSKTKAKYRTLRTLNQLLLREFEVQQDYSTFLIAKMVLSHSVGNDNCCLHTRRVEVPQSRVLIGARAVNQQEAYRRSRIERPDLFKESMCWRFVAAVVVVGNLIIRNNPLWLPTKGTVLNLISCRT